MKQLYVHEGGSKQIKPIKVRDEGRTKGRKRRKEEKDFFKKNLTLKFTTIHRMRSLKIPSPKWHPPIVECFVRM